MTIKMNRDTVSVWIQGNVWAGNIRAMLASSTRFDFKPANTILAADMILYTGGADVSPSLYGETILNLSYTDFDRDRRDKDCFDVARKSGKFQVGICRGSQFLNVMNGGTLWQDVTNHTGCQHIVQDVLTQKSFVVSSTHHQQSILNPDGNSGVKLLAWAEEADRKISAKGGWRKASGRPSLDVEAFWYPKNRCLGVQWHPEIGPNECTELFFDYVERFKDDVTNFDRQVG